MPSGAFPGKFTIIELADEIPPVAPATWVTIGEVYEIGDISISRASYDVTSHSASIWREHLDGIMEPVEFDLSLNAIGTSAVPAFTDFYTSFKDTGGSNRWFKVTLADGGVFTFEASITNLTQSTPLDERQTYKMSLKVYGEPTFVAS